jgi:peptidoglycan-associated lipoprotein|tara:strand:- start:5647 stop:6084 length:438 start_codon:yes stop_codon:yes gene_type:complete
VKITKYTYIGLALSALLSGCHSSDSDIYAVVNDGDLNNQQVTFTKRVSHLVEFEFDSSELPFNAAEVVEPHARYLIANPDIKVAIQGNASSEGGRGYNYNLGKERANAVKGLFLELGVDEKQLVVLSVGERHNNFIPKRTVMLGY